ncbi:MAG: hypothetical protein Q8L90_00355, partial [Bacteroidota bacterium]|nr:hypothetical protein [Bacteroidota bacterium]
MITKAITFIFLMICFNFSGLAQSKKTIKKFKIKSSTVTVFDVADGKEKSRTDSYQKYDNSGLVVEDVEYNKDGSFKKKELRKFNKNEDPIEEIVYDEKGNFKKKTITEYNVNKDKTAESVFDAKDK